MLSCQKQNDQISKGVALRVRLCNDLGTMEVRYHTSSKITLMNPKNIWSWRKKKCKEAYWAASWGWKVAASWLVMWVDWTGSRVLYSERVTSKNDWNCRFSNCLHNKMAKKKLIEKYEIMSFLQKWKESVTLCAYII